MNDKVSEIAKPFLRWAGGKSWLVKRIHGILPTQGYANYHEPFLGGASVFLALNPSGRSFLSDLNKELIETYKTLKSDADDIIDVLKGYENTEQFYYDLRSRIINDPVEHAARFIFLNQTSFNGIYRVNLKGEYNVPYGHRSKNFIEEEKLKLASKRLQRAELLYGDFEISKPNIKRKDLIFLDPPYTVSHNDNGFIKYNQKLFSIEDQGRLSSLIDYIKSKDAYYILTNAAHKKIDEIFDKKDRKIVMSRASLIGGNNAERGQTKEFVFTNIIGSL